MFFEYLSKILNITNITNITNDSQLKKQQIIEQMIEQIMKLDNDESILKISEKLDFEIEMQERINTKCKSFYNQHQECEYQKTNDWTDMAQDEIESHKSYCKTSLVSPELDMRWRSRYGNVGPDSFLSMYRNSSQTLLASDWMMFNKYDIDYSELDRFLGLCKIKYCDNCVQIDCWKIRYGMYNKLPNYSVSYDCKLESELSNMNFVNSDEDKRVCVKGLITIMNEIPDNYLNFNNYNVIGYWFNRQDLLLQTNTIVRKKN